MDFAGGADFPGIGRGGRPRQPAVAAVSTLAEVALCVCGRATGPVDVCAYDSGRRELCLEIARSNFSDELRRIAAARLHARQESVDPDWQNCGSRRITGLDPDRSEEHTRERLV